MKGFQIQQKGERRISAALRIMLVVVLLAVQIGVVVAISYFMQEYLALAYGVVQVGALFLAVHIYNEPGELSYKLIWFILLLLAPPVLNCAAAGRAALSALPNAPAEALRACAAEAGE